MSEVVKGMIIAYSSIPRIICSGFCRYNIDVADQPPCPPDLNPIEYPWVLLRCQDYHLAKTSAGSDAVKARLAELVTTAMLGECSLRSYGSLFLDALEMADRASARGREREGGAE